MAEADDPRARARHVRARLVEKAPRLLGPGAGVAYADPCRHRDAGPHDARVQTKRRDRRAEVGAVQITCNPQHSREPPRTVAAGAVGETSDRLHAAKEHRVAAAFGAADDVHALVHPVHEEHVRVARRPEERARSLRPAHSRVAREIPRTTVRFRLDDARPRVPSLQDATDEGASHDPRIPSEERPCQGVIGHLARL